MISGTVVMSVFNFHLKRQSEQIAESYYEIEPKTDEELLAEELEKVAAENQEKAETNRAFNETESYKRIAQAYQPIAPPKDYEYTPSESDASAENSKSNATSSQPELDDNVLSSYNSANDVLNKQRANMSAQSVNKKSTMHYSLVNRTHQFLPTPIYLCETGGKVVVNIAVNSKGLVTDAYINTASSSDNACLQEHAIEYAKDARFNTDASKNSQLGSITFYFEGKN